MAEPLKLEGEELRSFLWGKIKERFVLDNGREPTAEEALPMQNRLAERLNLPPLEVPAEDESIFLAEKLDATDLSDNGDEAENEDIDDELIERLREVLQGSDEQMQKLELAAGLDRKSDDRYEGLKSVMVGLTAEQQEALMEGCDEHDGDEYHSGSESDEDHSGSGSAKIQAGRQVAQKKTSKASSASTGRRKIKKTRAIGGVKVVYKKKQ